MCVCVCVCLVTQLCPTLCDRLFCPWNSPGKNTGVGCRASSRGFSRSQGSNALQTDSELPGKPKNTVVGSLSLLQGNLPDPGNKLGSLALQADSLPAVATKQ